MNLCVILMAFGASLTVVGSASELSQQDRASENGPTKTRPDAPKSSAAMARLLEEARRSAKDLNDSRDRARMFVGIAKAQIKAGGQAAARAFLEQAQQIADTIARVHADRNDSV
jgi:hypothetical protein